MGVQVRRANQLLAVYAAVAALRADEAFQEDASDPGVQDALADMGRTNNVAAYAGNAAVVSVATKLKKFHAVLQEAGGVRLGLPVRGARARSSGGSGGLAAGWRRPRAAPAHRDPPEQQRRTC